MIELTFTDKDYHKVAECEKRVENIVSHIPRHDRIEICEYRLTVLDAIAGVLDFADDLKSNSPKPDVYILMHFYPDMIKHLKEAQQALYRLFNHVEHAYRGEMFLEMDYVLKTTGTFVKLYSILMEEQANNGKFERKENRKRTAKRQRNKGKAAKAKA